MSYTAYAEGFPVEPIDEDSGEQPLATTEPAPTEKELPQMLLETDDGGQAAAAVDEFCSDSGSALSGSPRGKRKNGGGEEPRLSPKRIRTPDGHEPGSFSSGGSGSDTSGKGTAGAPGEPQVGENHAAQGLGISPVGSVVLDPLSSPDDSDRLREMEQEDEAETAAGAAAEKRPGEEEAAAAAGGIGKECELGAPPEQQESQDTSSNVNNDNDDGDSEGSTKAPAAEPTTTTATTVTGEPTGNAAGPGGDSAASPDEVFYASTIDYREADSGAGEVAKAPDIADISRPWLWRPPKYLSSDPGRFGAFDAPAPSARRSSSTRGTPTSSPSGSHSFSPRDRGHVRPPRAPSPPPPPSPGTVAVEMEAEGSRLPSLTAVPACSPSPPPPPSPGRDGCGVHVGVPPPPSTRLTSDAACLAAAAGVENVGDEERTGDATSRVQGADLVSAEGAAAMESDHAAAPADLDVLSDDPAVAAVAPPGANGAGCLSHSTAVGVVEVTAGVCEKDEELSENRQHSQDGSLISAGSESSSQNVPRNGAEIVSNVEDAERPATAAMAMAKEGENRDIGTEADEREKSVVPEVPKAGGGVGEEKEKEKTAAVGAKGGGGDEGEWLEGLREDALWPIRREPLMSAEYLADTGVLPQVCFSCVACGVWSVGGVYNMRMRVFVSSCLLLVVSTLPSFFRVRGFGGGGGEDGEGSCFFVRVGC